MDQKQSNQGVYKINQIKERTLGRSLQIVAPTRRRRWRRNNHHQPSNTSPTNELPWCRVVVEIVKVNIIHALHNRKHINIPCI